MVHRFRAAATMGGGRCLAPRPQFLSSSWRCHALQLGYCSKLPQRSKRHRRFLYAELRFMGCISWIRVGRCRAASAAALGGPSVGARTGFERFSEQL